MIRGISLTPDIALLTGIWSVCSTIRFSAGRCLTVLSIGSGADWGSNANYIVWCRSPPNVTTGLSGLDSGFVGVVTTAGVEADPDCVQSPSILIL
jgi:hypothetical protein